MDIKLVSMAIDNFKSLKKLTVNFSDHTTIKGQNGSGKTTIYDSFLWLMFGKDSDGKSDFSLRPLDSANEPVTGLVLSVEGQLEIDGQLHTLRKEHKEKRVRGEFRGFETLTWIDQVPKKISDFQTYINKIIPEDLFKLLTDLRHFNNLHWKEKRKILLVLAGQIGIPEGFDDLIAELNDRTVDEMKKALTDQRKGFKDEQDGIGPRIDEIQRGLTEYAADTNLTANREAIIEAMQDIDIRRDDLFADEKERQVKIEAVNGLKVKLSEREIALKSDTSGITDLLTLKSDIEKGIADCLRDVQKVEGSVINVSEDIKYKQEKLNELTGKKAELLKEYDIANQSITESVCYACGQVLPPDKLKEVETKRTETLNGIIGRGTAIKNQIESLAADIDGLALTRNDLQDNLQKSKDTYNSGIQYKEDNMPDIQKKIDANATTPPEQDDLWKGIKGEIAKAEKEVGESMAEAIGKIETEARVKSDELAGLDRALSQADQSAAAKTRIAELDTEKKRIAQAMANIEKKLKNIERFKHAESGMIESAVNGLFKHVKFKLFNTLINGVIEEACEATLNGTPYPDMSYGEKILVGTDIINVLSKHYKQSVPLFVDNQESLTFPLESDGQTIGLFAVPGMETLTVTGE